jgi:hypothetical protein
MTARWALAIVLGTALATHALFLALTQPRIIAISQDHYDARQYRELADSILAGEGFTLPRRNGRSPDLDRTPVYPLFVSRFGAGWENVPSVIVAQHTIVIVTALLVWWWVRARLGNAQAAVLAFAIVALDLTTMTYASYLLTESLFTFFFTVALVTWPVADDKHRSARAAVSGLAWGLATLTRPITLYLAPLALLLSLFAARKRPVILAHAAIALLCGSLVTGAWMVRNYRVSGHAVLSTIEGENLLNYRAALVSLPAGKPVEEWRWELAQAIDEAKYDRADPRQAAALDAAKKAKAVELIASHPLGLHRLFVLGLPRMFVTPNRRYLFNLLGVSFEEWPLNDVTGALAIQKHISAETLYLGASGAYQVALLAAALAGTWVAWRRKMTWIIVPVVAVVYMAIFSSGLETHSRFRVPVVPALAVLAALAAHAAWTAWFGPSKRER